jgi:hypothetical protein
MSLKSINLSITFVIVIFNYAICQNNALNLDNSTSPDYVHISNSPLIGNNNFTIEFHAKTNISGTSLYNRAIGFQSFELDIAINNNVLYIFDEAWYNTGTAISNGIWYHIAITFNNGTLTVYVDGSNVFSLSNRAFNFTSQFFRIGAKQGSVTTNTSWNGEIDELRFWTKSLSQTEIQNVNNCELIGNELCLGGYWNFNQGTAGGNNSGETTLNDLHSNNNDGTLTNFTLSGSTSNWVTSVAGISGSCSNVMCSALPVDLIEFAGNVYNKGVNLKWITANELNNLGFDIQKSNNGRYWQVIDFIEGKGTTNEINEYQYQDSNPYSGINYYRLRQIDYDGQYNYSDIAIVRYEGNGESSIYPNPATSEVTITITEPTTLQIMDVYGRVLINQNIPEGQNTINLSELPVGILIFMLGDQRYKVMKE